MIGEQHADWLNTAMTTEVQLRSLPAIYDNWAGGWREYSANAVAESPVLRALIRNRPNEWPTLDPLLADYDAGHAQAAQPAQS